MVRSIQPWLIIDNRLEGSAEDSGSILTANPTEYSGDFASPEQMIPPAGIRNELGDPVPWEACLTLNNNWGSSSSDRHYKSAEMVIHMLVECVSKGGNLLLNVGPDAKGRIPKESVKILEEVGEWMDENSKSIYGCGYLRPRYGAPGRSNPSHRNPRQDQKTPPSFRQFRGKAYGLLEPEGILPESVLFPQR